MALIPLHVFASDDVSTESYSTQMSCQNTTDTAEKKDCLAIEKKNEAQENFKNFQDNNHNQSQDNF